jgi:hypothetical protein
MGRVLSQVVAFFSWIGAIFFGLVVLGTAAVLIDGSYAGSFGQWLVQELVQGALFAGCVCGAVWSWRKRKALPKEERSKLGLGCLVIAALCVTALMSAVLWGQWTNRRVGEETKRLAPPVIQALERYKAARKELPQFLEELVPDYLPALPRCEAGWTGPRMAYRRLAGGHYELACPAFLFTRYRYSSESGEYGLSD